ARCDRARSRNRSWPVERLSNATTPWPRSSRRSTRLLPMKPAPPVTSTLEGAVKLTPGAPAPRSPLPSRAAQHRPRRARQNPEVEHQAPAIDVFQIEADPLIEFVDAVPAADLPQTGDAGLHAQLALVPERVAIELAAEGRPRSHQAHVALEHAPQLRQLVEAVLAQDATERRDARIVSDLEYGALHLVLRLELHLPPLCVSDHRGELVAGERVAVQADHAPRVQDRQLRRREL